MEETGRFGGFFESDEVLFVCALCGFGVIHVLAVLCVNFLCTESDLCASASLCPCLRLSQFLCSYGKLKGNKAEVCALLSDIQQSTVLANYLSLCCVCVNSRSMQ